MKTNFLGKGKAWLLVFLFLTIGITDANAGIYEPEPLTISGMLRQTAVLNTGIGNPNNIEKADFNLIRSMFQIEISYEPIDILRLFIKGRVTHDQTYMLQGEVDNYDTSPWTLEHHGLDLQTGYDEDSFNAQIAEVWANIETDLWWIRLGKQQIAWGDVPGLRVADRVNPLDLSWHLNLEPEEYENIRIAEWAARVYFSLPETMTGPFSEIFIDTFYNPGDVHPDMQPSVGSPYDKGFRGLSGQNEDRDFILRGEDEWGARLGMNIGQLATTFAYMAVHNDIPVWDFFNAPEETMTPTGTVYPETDVWAMTMSYAFTDPTIRTIVSAEASYTPDAPWQSTAPGPPAMEEAAFTRFVIWAERDMFFLNKMSRFFFPGKFMLLYYIHHVSDSETVKLSPAPLGESNRLDWDYDLWYFSWTQGFGQGKSHELTQGYKWSPDGAYQIQIRYKYQPNYDYRLDIGAQWNGGSGERAFGYNNSSWNDEVFLRLTFYFQLL
ncbi:MAG: hypothetical protein GY864_05290 [Desulfobacterales bacterium]|nr:hypothetical protein [Desulfobacterales bacterium]